MSNSLNWTDNIRSQEVAQLPQRTQQGFRMDMGLVWI